MHIHARRVLAALATGLLLIATIVVPSGTADASESRDVQVRITVRLADAVIAPGNVMRVDLFDRNILPTEDPYGTGITFDRSDFEDQQPIRRPTDWVRVELRDTDDPSVIVAEFSALLRADGLIIDETGGYPRVAIDSSTDNVHVVVFHKSSLPAASPSVAIWDLSFLDRLQYSFARSEASPFFGTHQLEIDTTLPWQEYGLMGGNLVQGDSTDDDTYDINGMDISSFSAENGNFGVYLPQDLNLDGSVDGADKALLTTNRNGSFSGIPH